MLGANFRLTVILDLLLSSNLTLYSYIGEKFLSSLIIP